MFVERFGHMVQWTVVHIAIHRLMFCSKVYAFVRFDRFDSIHAHIKECELLLSKLVAESVDGSF